MYTDGKWHSVLDAEQTRAVLDSRFRGNDKTQKPIVTESEPAADIASSNLWRRR